MPKFLNPDLPNNHQLELNIGFLSVKNHFLDSPSTNWSAPALKKGRPLAKFLSAPKKITENSFLSTFHQGLVTFVLVVRLIHLNIVKPFTRPDLTFHAIIFFQYDV